MDVSTESLSRRARKLDRTLVVDLALIALIRCATILLVNPMGDFPLLDDWSFGRTVKHLIETGDYHPVGWGLMTLVTNVFWGALFCLPTGFSFTALRISTLVASLLGMAGAYVLVREMRRPRWFAILAALTLGFGPFYYNLSNTFMTDVLFTALVTWASVFYARSLRGIRNSSILIGTALAVAATLSRQLALCVPIAFAATLLMNFKLSSRVMIRAATPLVLCVSALTLFRSWIRATGRTPWHWGKFDDGLLKNISDIHLLTVNIVDHTPFALVNLGLVCVPIIPILTAEIFRADAKRARIAILFGLAIILLLGLLRAHFGLSVILPIYDNVLVNSGVGPTMLRDVFDLHLDNLLGIPHAFWITLTALGVLAAASLLAVLIFGALEMASKGIRLRSTETSDPVPVFLGFCCIFYLLLVLPSYFFFDRYVTPLFPLVAASLTALSSPPTEAVHAKSSGQRTIAFVLLAALSVFSIITTRDYLTWNRVRWTALRDLMNNDHVAAQDIDGGFEFNGLYHFQTGAEDRFAADENPDAYVIAFGPVPGYVVLKEYTYLQWLPRHVQNIVVLQKK